eukprot:958785-Prymnesium_polylepis.1
MTAVRYADYVAAGCIGPEPRENGRTALTHGSRSARTAGGARLSMSSFRGGMPGRSPRPIRTRTPGNL